MDCTHFRANAHACPQVCFEELECLDGLQTMATTLQSNELPLHSLPVLVLLKHLSTDVRARPNCFGSGWGSGARSDTERFVSAGS